MYLKTCGRPKSPNKINTNLNNGGYEDEMS